MTGINEHCSERLSIASRKRSLSDVAEILCEWRSSVAPSALQEHQLGPAIAAAITNSQTSIVSYLLDQGALVSSIDITLALHAENVPKMFQTFIDHGWDINSRTSSGSTVLKHVVRDYNLTEWFLTNSADPNAFGTPGSTILDVAAANSTPATFTLLLSHGARLEDSDPIHAAAGELNHVPGRVTMMEFLLDQNVDINALGRRDYPAGRGRGRGTPLHAAVASQEIDKIALLMKRGADLDARNTLGQTPLEYAIAKGFKPSIEILSVFKR